MKTRKKKFAKVPVDVPISDLSPLNVNCGSTKCEDGLHCFRLTKSQIKKLGKSGVCKSCGVDVVNWKRIYEKNPLDAPFIFKSLKNELIRWVYWQIPVASDDIDKAHKRGVEEMERKIIHRLTNVIGIERPWRNGYTPYSGDVIYYAQHGTATCCRRCMEYWYDIPMGRRLNEEEILFAKELIMLYLRDRVPRLFSSARTLNVMQA